MDSMDSAEFTEWMAMYALEPWGSNRDDMRALYLAGMSVAPYAKGGKAPKAREFFGHLWSQIPPQSDEEIEMYLRMWATACGGEVKG
jgi:hypothetical protein